MRRVIEADPLGLAARIFAVDQRHRHPVGDRVEQRDGDLAALAGALAGVKRLQDRRVRVHAAADVGDGNADPAGESGPPVIEARPVSHWMRKS